MQQYQPATVGLRLAEVIAALSLATDLGMGQPLEFALSSCVLAVRLGETLGLAERDLRDVYYLALLRHIGCNVDAHLIAAFMGDEIALHTTIATADFVRPTEMLGVMLRHFRQLYPEASPLHFTRLVVSGFWGMTHLEGTAVCEVAERLAARLGFGETMQQALVQAYERWDGRGFPQKLKGEAVALAVRVVAVAQDVILLQRTSDAAGALAVVKARMGGAYEPRIVECLCRHAPQLLAGLQAEPSWATVLALEPGVHGCLSATQFDTVCRAIADFTDLKTPYTLGHSSGVAELAAAAAQHAGLSEADVVALRRAGMLHDVGRTGISGGIWAKPGPLSEREWERVRLHPYYTERILARPAALAQLGSLAAFHHERLDGSGYHRGAKAALLSPAARILAAADVYHALTEPRPHRPARPPEQATAELLREVQAGRLDSEAARAVLAAVGHHVPTGRRAVVAGLSAREVEVLRLLARGHSKKQIAGMLIISQKTVDHHTQHIYSKIGVSTRAGATLFAMQHDLLTDRG